MNFFDHTQNLHPAQSTTPGVQADAAKDTTKAKDAAKGGVPTASRTHENSHEPDAGSTPPAKPSAHLPLGQRLQTSHNGRQLLVVIKNRERGENSRVRSVIEIRYFIDFPGIVLGVANTQPDTIKVIIGPP